MTIVGRGLLRNCETSIFTKVRLQLYRTPLLVMEQVPGSSSQASLHCLAGIRGQYVPTQARWSSLVLAWPLIHNITFCRVSVFLLVHVLFRDKCIYHCQAEHHLHSPCCWDWRHPPAVSRRLLECWVYFLVTVRPRPAQHQSKHDNTAQFIAHHTDDDVMLDCISNISMSPLDNVAPCSVVTNKLLAPSVTLGSHVTTKHKQPNIYTYLHISTHI